MNAFTVFSVLRPRIHGKSVGILNLVGSNRHVPCVNKTLHLCYLCALLVLSLISHPMLGHTVALFTGSLETLLEKTVNAFTVFSQVS